MYSILCASSTHPLSFLRGINDALSLFHALTHENKRTVSAINFHLYDFVHAYLTLVVVVMLSTLVLLHYVSRGGHKRQKSFSDFRRFVYLPGGFFYGTIRRKE